MEYVCTAVGGLGNQAIARRVFTAVHDKQDIGAVAVMWSFPSRYDWAMPEHKMWGRDRWVSVSPWDTRAGHEEAMDKLAESQIQQEIWEKRTDSMSKTGVRDFADSLYKHAANEYHEIYLSWKSITWLQNILEKKRIPFFFTLADNTLFYNNFTHHKEMDGLMNALHTELDLTKWFSFGERMMGFNQWALLNNYERATTHPLDQAHSDAVKLMLPTFEKIIGAQR
jgi:hemerythrin superfamily protein